MLWVPPNRLYSNSSSGGLSVLSVGWGALSPCAPWFVSFWLPPPQAYVYFLWFCYVSGHSFIHLINYLL